MSSLNPKNNKSKHGKARSKLNKFSAELDVDEDYQDGLLGSKKNEKLTPNWHKVLIGSGSNAFGQSVIDSLDLVNTVFTLLKPIPGTINEEEIQHLACGSNFTLTIHRNIVKHELFDDGKAECSDNYYTWGAPLITTTGITNHPMKIPKPFPESYKVKQVSSGHSHAGFITMKEGFVFTWGTGDYGMLGHGNKLSSVNPKRIDSMVSKVCIGISCGAYHTALISCDRKDPIPYVTIPTLGTSSHPMTTDFIQVGKLYTFGEGKAGQLGLDSLPQSNSISNQGIVVTPTLVNYFDRGGWYVTKVSCGFHHTLVIATPIASPSTLPTSPHVSSNEGDLFIGSLKSFVFSFGWGEHGRLGTGHEDQSMTPTMVQFPQAFQALDIAAGEQHSLASGIDACYAWGSNSMGQLGVSSPQYTEISCLPMKIPLPEGMIVKTLCAGGRHSGAVTYCGKLLTWGWNDEGQLGHGNEKSSYLPRPCRLPKVMGKAGVPIDIKMGMSHTMVVLMNRDYDNRDVLAQRVALRNALLQPIATKPIPAVVVVPDPVVQEEEEEVIEQIEVVPSPKYSMKPAMMIVEEVEEVSVQDIVPEKKTLPPIRSIKELLHQRDERSKKIHEEEEDAHEQIEEQLNEPFSKFFLTENLLSMMEDVPDRSKEDKGGGAEGDVVHGEEQDVGEVEERIDREGLSIQEHTPAPLPHTTTTATATVSSKGVHVYYKKGQSLDNCLVANYAKRVETRKSQGTIRRSNSAKNSIATSESNG